MNNPNAHQLLAEMTKRFQERQTSFLDYRCKIDELFVGIEKDPCPGAKLAAARVNRRWLAEKRKRYELNKSK